uniref:DNA-formamidopyrimidine glycosylase n=1 Tax=Mimivirus LCMiAC01 TaxID=2506608 RepID=A0A481Z0Y6_9VIRU|nr:MAG: formamidopyrimidine-DNA glycosylase [Mimivirus LCMiAC01]
MPEIVECLITALFLHHKFKNKQITKIKILSGRYKKTPIKGLSGFKKNLPLTIKKIDSKGKFIWFSLYNQDNDYYIMNTLGLTGSWTLTKKKHSRISFTIKKNDRTYKLYYTDPRNFGTIKMTTNKKMLDDKLISLGPDFLKTSFTKQEFFNRIEKYIHKKNGTISLPRANRHIIKVLMDQKASGGLGSGIGSYLAVEILYHAKISPLKKMKYIYRDKKLAYQLAKSIKYIIKLAYITADIGYMAHLDNTMAEWVKKLRKKIRQNKNHKYNYHPGVKLGNNIFKFRVYRQKFDPHGNKVTPGKIIPGRTTYYSPAVQK